MESLDAERGHTLKLDECISDLFRQRGVDETYQSGVISRNSHAPKGAVALDGGRNGGVGEDAWGDGGR